ncbi:hypothetical protein QQF64_008270 [Cirrhinus molitorella]|uniref:Uncharacterized protein n=1 Tax=Cirrhinus molitorella TaxID=172907 RepID=A0ABR3M5N7_9TELE
MVRADCGWWKPLVIPRHSLQPPACCTAFHCKRSRTQHYSTRTLFALQLSAVKHTARLIHAHCSLSRARSVFLSLCGALDIFPPIHFPNGRS